MSFPEILLDTSWTIHFIQNTTGGSSLHQLLSASQTQRTTTSQQCQRLSESFRRYLSSIDSGYKDELNDETERTGQLKECMVDRLTLSDTHQLSGLSIQARYQRSTYTAVLLNKQPRQRDDASSSVLTLLYKATQAHVKKLKNWLDVEFGLHTATPLQLPPPVLLTMTSHFVNMLDESLVGNADDDGNGANVALRQATFKQVIGNLKIVVTFSGATGDEKGIAPQLKTMDFDVPAESVAALVNKAKERKQTEGLEKYDFLDELKKALHERTGLRLPLTPEKHSSETAVLTTMTVAGQGNDISGNNDSAMELDPPLKVTKITSAAFALSMDGRLKLASKPIQDAEIVGYDEKMVRAAYLGLLQYVCTETERRNQDVD